YCATIAKGEEPARVIYLSTSGVYGDGSDEPVTEESIPNPTTSRGKRRLDGERAFTAFCQERDIPLVILRVTGIYGPGRLPIRQITEGQPLLREDIAPLTNRIHADDLASVALAAAQRGEGGDIYNVSDGHPTTMNTYFNAVADACGLPRPRQVSLEEARQLMSPLMFSYATESRRLDSQKMLSKLGVTLHYPDLLAGISASCDPDA
ncbi:MAG TPA: NAD-dependent epimerase/dehydratase family protein, partial [Geobacterales bacterium]|nr:NAD-dependent epimerase/dehydratase family protein [Geobacterales bacterium]